MKRIKKLYMALLLLLAVVANGTAVVYGGAAPYFETKADISDQVTVDFHTINIKGQRAPGFVRAVYIGEEVQGAKATATVDGVSIQLPSSFEVVFEEYPLRVEFLNAYANISFDQLIDYYMLGDYTLTVDVQTVSPEEFEAIHADSADTGLRIVVSLYRLNGDGSLDRNWITYMATIRDGRVVFPYLPQGRYFLSCSLPGIEEYRGSAGLYGYTDLTVDADMHALIHMKETFEYRVQLHGAMIDSVYWVQLAAPGTDFIVTYPYDVSNGRARFREVAPGNYDLIVRDSEWNAIARRPVVIANEPSGQTDVYFG